MCTCTSQVEHYVMNEEIQQSKVTLVFPHLIWRLHGFGEMSEDRRRK